MHATKYVVIEIFFQWGRVGRAFELIARDPTAVLAHHPTA
jgi:hypothetical protein